MGLLAISPTVAASEPPSIPRPASGAAAGGEGQCQPTEAAAAARWGRGQQLDRRMRRRLGALAGACWALLLGLLLGLLGRGPACVVDAFQGPFVVGGGQAR